MNPYAISPLICAAFALSLGLFVLFKNPKSPINRSFFVLAYEAFHWEMAWFISFYLTSDVQLNICAKIAFTSVLFLPFSYYHFVIRSLRQFAENKKKIMAFYLLGLFWLIILWSTDLLIAGHRKFSWGAYPKNGILLPLYILSLGIGILFIAFALIRRIKDKSFSHIVRNEAKFIFLAYSLFTCASVEFLIDLGLVDFYPIGVYFILASFSVIAYAITRHHLMDIEVVIKRTVVFAGTFAFVFGVFVGITLLISQLIGGGRLISLLISAVLITLGLRPIESWLVNATDKFLFQKKYQYKQIIQTFIDEVITELNLDKVINSTLRLLDGTLHPYTSAVFILNKAEDKFQLYNAYGLENKNLTFASESKLVDFLKKTKDPAVIKQIDGITGVSPEIVSEMGRLKAVVVLPLMLHNDLIGFISLGKKKSDEEYTKDDLDVLLDLARTESIAVANALLLTEAAQAERRAAIGTMAAGIHHEIGNPLNVMTTKIQLFKLAREKGLLRNKSNEELLNQTGATLDECLKQSERISEITRKLANFAKPGKEFKPELISIPVEIDEVLAVFGHELELEKIKIEKQFSQDLPQILADRREIQQIFFNIIRNAAQAIEGEGVVTISAVPAANNKVHIEIQDTGKGIPGDKEHRIFEPFFTTKGTSKGTGLGLSIVRQLVWRNKGEISFRSQVGVGTTFILEFPQGKG